MQTNEWHEERKKGRRRRRRKRCPLHAPHKMMLRIVVQFLIGLPSEELSPGHVWVLSTSFPVLRDVHVGWWPDMVVCKFRLVPLSTEMIPFPHLRFSRSQGDFDTFNTVA
jgi:hypothetical protein